MIPVSIKLPEENEREFRRRAAAENKPLGTYLREVLLAEKQEPKLDRVSIEDRVDALNKQVEMLYDAIIRLTDDLAYYAEYQREYLTQYIISIDSEEKAVEAINNTDEIMAKKYSNMTGVMQNDDREDHRDSQR